MNGSINKISVFWIYPPILPIEHDQKPTCVRQKKQETSSGFYKDMKGKIS